MNRYEETMDVGDRQQDTEDVQVLEQRIEEVRN